MSRPVEIPAANPIDRISPTLEPHRGIAGRQCWRNLAFVHWRVPSAIIEPLLPRELTLDTWEGDAWIGLVPFTMTGVRPWWSPPVPGISNFHETNVRTYVHFRGQQPGVWFFSLDAANQLACRLARWGWHLPYHYAKLDLQRKGNVIDYQGVRRQAGSPSATLRMSVTIGDLIPSMGENLVPGQAAPGTLEHFLAERYLLYTRSPSGRLYSGQVHHTPYPLREATLNGLEETMLAASGIAPPEPPCHVLFSDGVRVKVYGLQQLS